MAGCIDFCNVSKNNVVRFGDERFAGITVTIYTGYGQYTYIAEITNTYCEVQGRAGNGELGMNSPHSPSPHSRRLPRFFAAFPAWFGWNPQAG